MAQEKAVVFNLFAVRARLEAVLNRRVHWQEIAAGSRLNINTVVNMANNKTSRVDCETLTKLLRYFRGQGLDITVGDLFREQETAAP